jgi:peptide/nickel transport system ATP-binding protein
MPKSLNDTSAAITLEKVSRVYHGRHRRLWRPQRLIIALKDIDLTIARGEIFGLVGESGSGKTTLARLMVRLEKPDQGRILMDGMDIGSFRGVHLRNFRRRVQMIFQDPYQSLNPYQSVQGIVQEPLEIHRWRNSHARTEKVNETLAMVGLDTTRDILKRYPHQLSGGQRQRVAIARAMILDPDVLLADEPTSMLDACIAIQIYQILSNIQKSRQATMVFITHSLAAAHYLCDRIAVIYRGHVVESGPAKTIIAAPRHPYTQALLDALPNSSRSATHRRFNTLRHPELATVASEGCPFFSRCLRADETLCSRLLPPMVSVAGQHRTACFFAEEDLSCTTKATSPLRPKSNGD